MIKTVNLLKRRSGMSMEDFIEHYESTHRRIGEKYLKGHACHYIRRYLFPVPDPATGESYEAEYDVLLEIWYPNEAAYQNAMAAINAPEAAAEISADEANLFDRSSMRSFHVREFESDM
ncbi:EthD domain-containing protein [Elongatibacter sediminis]|uniref:EthD domain-containing protein n=1 Tax=Elongatibacter sediminis TaxID=3119006 RepID=A0AAW9RFT2_9GAMM